MLRIGLFPGSFDPPTLGHFDIIEKSKILVDHLIIAVHSSETSLFSFEEKRLMLQKIAPKSKIVPLNGLVVDLAKEMEAEFLIRGLRTPADFDYEFQMASANRHLSGIETIFFMANDDHTQISASLIREIIKHKGSLNGLVPKQVEKIIQKKFS